MKAYSIAVVSFILFAAIFISRGPVINDITTSFPAPTFLNEKLRDSSYDNDFYQVQKKHYPLVEPLLLSINPDQAFELVRRVLSKCYDWEVSYVKEGEQFEAIATTKLLGFKDDVLVRVSTNPKGSKIDMRSRSRVGKSDLGANASRIIDFMKTLESGGCDTPR